MPYEILGIGAPLLDHIVMITEEEFLALRCQKGGSRIVDYHDFEKVLNLFKKDILIAAGGSASNTIKGLANLGHSCALIGSIGRDLAGTRYIEDISSINITSLHIKSSTPTGKVICFVTPDGQRTFHTYLGAGEEFKPNDLSLEVFQGIKLVHIEGYSLLNKGLTEHAMKLAKLANVKISLDLASFDLVEEHRTGLVSLIARYVDVVFANRDEIKALTGVLPSKGCDFLKDLCETAVVLLGDEGCLIGRGETLVSCPAFPVTALDTTGAGDLFASGFLSGYIQGKSIEECARLGAIAGHEVVQVLGAHLSKDHWNRIKAKF